jgi:hypothetical protein
MTKKDKAPETEPKTESKNNYNFTINVIEGEVENIKLSYS